MITLSAGLAIGAVTFLGAFTSGIFGMVGGQFILAVLLYYMPVSAAMTLFSALMFMSGLWRGILWRRHIDWPLTWRYVAGSIIGYVLMLFIAFVPSKPVVYLGLGLTPLIGSLLPKHLAPDITKRGMAPVCGFIVIVLQIAIGGAGNVLDMFFQASPLSRHVIVATKAVTQLFSQAMRFLYFGALALEASEYVPIWLFVVYVLLTFAGGSAATGVLNRMSDANFRKWTQWLIWALSAIYTGRGLWLLAFPSGAAAIL
ncbi:MAG: sulfite exporter TauE/SafE family protein [Rhizobiales bacterium]|nr:sulfite exporter TauE/SafE family protein [Hyphomicrobiales bacterium]